MKLGVIYARSRNGVIGKEGKLPWHLPEDLAHFKQVTLGCPVIMGRKTWDSLPPRFRPLPGRTNIVVTRQPGWAADGATRAGSLDEALRLCNGNGNGNGNGNMVWVIGGAEMYGQAMPMADIAEVTVLDADYQGDAFAPDLGPHWQETQRSTHVAASGIAFQFITYQNTQRAHLDPA